jgi:hypothetical protein
MEEAQRLSEFQELMLVNAHPSKMVLNTIGGALALFYLYGGIRFYLQLFWEDFSSLQGQS